MARYDESGKIDQGKGRLRRAFGELFGSRRQKNLGTVDKAAGSVKEGVSRVQGTIKETMERSEKRNR